MFHKKNTNTLYYSRFARNTNMLIKKCIYSFYLTLLKSATIDTYIVAPGHLLVIPDLFSSMSRSFVACVIEKILWLNVGYLSATIVWLVQLLPLISISTSISRYMHCISSRTTTNKSSYMPYFLLMQILRPQRVVLKKDKFCLVSSSSL